jgi:septal ring factor EnvC (AmiA/AmiB activator)
MSSERVFTLEKEVAVINSKLDEIQSEFKKLNAWMIRHESEHEKIREDRDEIRRELRHHEDSASLVFSRLERDQAAFMSRQNVINAILGFLAGAAASTLVTMIVTGSLI